MRCPLSIEPSDPKANRADATRTRLLPRAAPDNVDAAPLAEEHGCR